MSYTAAAREHEALEAKLRELMLADDKARQAHDKLAGALAATLGELEQIATQKQDLLKQLQTHYKKPVNGNGKRRKS